MSNFGYLSPSLTPNLTFRIQIAILPILWTTYGRIKISSSPKSKNSELKTTHTEGPSLGKSGQTSLPELAYVPWSSVKLTGDIRILELLCMSLNLRQNASCIYRRTDRKHPSFYWITANGVSPLLVIKTRPSTDNNNIFAGLGDHLTHRRPPEP